MQNLGLKTLIFGKFTGKIEILSTHNLSVGKLQLSASRTRFNPLSMTVALVKAAVCVCIVWCS